MQFHFKLDNCYFADLEWYLDISVLAHGLYEDSDVGENGDNGDNVLHDDHDLTEQSFNILHECYDIPKLTVRPPVIQRNNEHEAIVCDEVTDCSPSNQAPAHDSQAGEGGADLFYFYITIQCHSATDIYSYVVTSAQILRIIWSK